MTMSDIQPKNIVQNTKDITWLHVYVVCVIIALVVCFIFIDDRLDELEEHTHACVITNTQTIECGIVLKDGSDDE